MVGASICRTGKPVSTYARHRLKCPVCSHSPRARRAPEHPQRASTRAKTLLLLDRLILVPAEQFIPCNALARRRVVVIEPHALFLQELAAIVGPSPVAITPVGGDDAAGHQHAFGMREVSYGCRGARDASSGFRVTPDCDGNVTVCRTADGSRTRVCWNEDSGHSPAWRRAVGGAGPGNSGSMTILLNDSGGELRLGCMKVR